MSNDTDSLSWVIPCDQDFGLSITIGGGTYQMNKGQLMSTDSTGTVCTSRVKGWADPAIRTHLFGAPFANSAYITYNAQADPSQDQIGVAPRTTIVIMNQGVSTATLVGAIVGSILGVTLLLVSLFLLFLFLRKRRAHSPGSGSSEKKSDDKKWVDPFAGGPPPNSATPMMSTSPRQNSWVEHGEPGEGNTLMMSSPVTTPRTLDGMMPPHLDFVRQSQVMDSSRLSSFPGPSPIPEQRVMV